MQLPFKITFWRVLLAIVWLAGAYAVIIRFTQGLGAATNLSDKFPWGLWVGFDVVTGVDAKQQLFNPTVQKCI